VLVAPTRVAPSPSNFMSNVRMKAPREGPASVAGVARVPGEAEFGCEESSRQV